MTDLEKCAPSLLPTLFRPEAHSTLTVPIRPKSWIGSFVSSSSLAVETTALPCGDNRSRAWFTVLGAFICLFGTFGQMNAFGSFQSWYTHHQLQHLSPSTISWIGSLQLWVFFFSVSHFSLASHSRCSSVNSDSVAIKGWCYWSCIRRIWAVLYHDDWDWSFCRWLVAHQHRHEILPVYAVSRAAFWSWGWNDVS
jgi:hypothetical protein